MLQPCRYAFVLGKVGQTHSCPTRSTASRHSSTDLDINTHAEDLEKPCISRLTFFRATSCQALGSLCLRAGACARAYEVFGGILAVGTALSKPAWIGAAHGNMGASASMAGDTTRACWHYEQVTQNLGDYTCTHIHQRVYLQPLIDGDGNMPYW